MAPFTSFSNVQILLVRVYKYNFMKLDNNVSEQDILVNINDAYI